MRLGGRFRRISGRKSSTHPVQKVKPWVSRYGCDGSNEGEDGTDIHRECYETNSFTARRLQRVTADKELRDRFERVIVLEGDLTPEQRERLLEIAERCPVSQALKRGSDIVSLLAGP